MNTYLISIQKQHNENIFTGKKRFEGRKKIPKTIEIKNYPDNTMTYIPQSIDTKFVVYETKNGGGCGKVIGEFICDYAQSFRGQVADFKLIAKALCVSIEFAKQYFDKDIGYMMRICEPKLYDKPKELGEFYSIKQCKPEYSPFGYQWTWEDRHKRNTGGRENEYRPVPIECHRCKSLVGGKDYLDEKSGCILFDYECISNYHKPLARPPQSYMRIQDPKEV